MRETTTSRSIGWTGRLSSVNVACTQAASSPANAGSDSNSSRVPRNRASGRGTGAGMKVVAAMPPAPRSISHDPFRWVASEKE